MWKFSLWYKFPNEEKQIFLGEAQFGIDRDKDKIKEELMERFWRPYLDTVGAIPIVVEADKPEEESK